MIMKSKVWRTILLTPLLLMTGCNGSSEAPDPTLRLVLSGLQQASEKTFFRTFTRLFEAEYGVDVEVVYESASTLYDKIALEKSNSDITSDIVMVDTAHMHPFVEADLMSDLSFLETSYPKRTFTTFFDSYTHQGGTRYFTPVSFDVYLSMFNKAALPYIPSSVQVKRDAQESITQIESITYQEIATWAKTIATETGQAKFGFPYSRVGSQLLYPLGGMALAMGDHSFPSFSDEGAIKAWQYLSDLVAHDALAFGTGYSSSSQPTDALNSEALWLSFAHMGPLGSAYAAHPDRYVLGPTPIDETTNMAGSTAGAWAFGIVEETKNLTAAQKWIEFITSPEINYLYCSNLGGVISPIQEAMSYLGSSATDKIMDIGLMMFETVMEIIIVDTSEYTSWDGVKSLYVDLYLELISDAVINQTKLTTYQSALDALKKP